GAGNRHRADCVAGRVDVAGIHPVLAGMVCVGTAPATRIVLQLVPGAVDPDAMRCVPPRDVPPDAGDSAGPAPRPRQGNTASPVSEQLRAADVVADYVGADGGAPGNADAVED